VHGIDPKLVDERALNVVQRCKQAGYEAYIVGGAVRDLLVGLRPRTSTWPPTPRPSRSRACSGAPSSSGGAFASCTWCTAAGREHEVIEVSTFRAYMDNAAAEQVAGNERTSKGELAGMKHAVDSSGRVLRDNVWGPQDEDAARRDFTINAMYYDPETQMVVDYHGGIADAKKRLLRMIGDPATRYREDPVRIIRAVRFAAKLSPLGFKLDPRPRRWCPRSRCWPTCRRAACSTKCSSCCRPATRWPPSSSSKSWAWRAASTRCWTWWWSAPSSPL
jgi:poly(A) polymerase